MMYKVIKGRWNGSAGPSIRGEDYTLVIFLIFAYELLFLNKTKPIVGDSLNL